MKEIPIHCSYDKLVPRREMLPHELNPNTHPPEQIALFAKILESTGLRRPFRVSKLSGKITAGHGALLACDLLKIDLLPVDFQDYEDEREEMMDLAADNRLAEFAETDDDALAELARQLLAANELAESPVDLGVSGYSAEFLEDLASNLIGEEEEGGEKDPPDPKPLSGSIFDLMGKTTGIDPDELCEYKVKMTTNQPRTWKVDPERRTITFKKGEA